MKILYAEADFWEKQPEFTGEYEKVIKDAYKFAKDRLPSVPDQVTFVCQTNDWECIPETGEGAFTKNSRLILLNINPELPFGKQKLLENVEAAVLHELNHAARYETGIMHNMLFESCIMEGLATVFERHYSKRGVPLWGKYDRDDAAAWYEEIKQVQNSFEWNDFMYAHPDGRRWIGYKVGTWIVDEALKNTSKTIEELTIMPIQDILKLAKLA